MASRPLYASVRVTALVLGTVAAEPALAQAKVCEDGGYFKTWQWTADDLGYSVSVPLDQVLAQLLVRDDGTALSAPTGFVDQDIAKAIVSVDGREVVQIPKGDRDVFSWTQTLHDRTTAALLRGRTSTIEYIMAGGEHRTFDIDLTDFSAAVAHAKDRHTQLSKDMADKRCQAPDRYGFDPDDEF